MFRPISMQIVLSQTTSVEKMQQVKMESPYIDIRNLNLQAQGVSEQRRSSVLSTKELEPIIVKRDLAKEKKERRQGKKKDKEKKGSLVDLLA